MSKIEWTDRSDWNPIRGCTRVSEGCRNCYAEGIAARFSGAGQPWHGFAEMTANGPRWTGKVELIEDRLTLPLKWRKPAKIFVNSMSDLFHESVPDEWIDRIFAVMALAPQHTFQVLTKRAKRMREYCSDQNRETSIDENLSELVGKQSHASDNLVWPLPNVWLGVTAEDQTRADERRDDLHTLSLAGWRTFVSYEPALGPVDWRLWTFLNWFIAGGESGPRARAPHPDWLRTARDFCELYDIPYFFKQWGEWHTAAIRISNGEAVFRQFDTFQQWVNKASTWVNGGICLDRLGRNLQIGADFMRARDEGTFPVTIMHRMGKRLAGSLLDGREHKEFPHDE